MVREILMDPGRTFQEFSLLPGYTKKQCVIKNISLAAKLNGLELGIPLLSAAMTSVTGFDMALALGKMGGIGILPARLSVEEQVAIV
jgi:IMP dehydrogenase